VSEGLHPQFIAEGYEAARNYCVTLLDEYKIPKEVNRELLLNVARTSLRTKIHAEMANQLTDIVTDAVLSIKKPDTTLDLFMVEIMHMTHKMSTETKLVRGLVLDHGARHPDMPKRLENCFILTCNVNLEYEKTEVNSGFFYKTAEQREGLQSSERKFTDEKIQKIIDLKRSVCEGTNKTFVLINQKGIDPPSLDALARENIIALRRAKRRNMERLVQACGGNAVHSVDELTPEDLGYAGVVYEHELGEEKYTFVEDVPKPFSCTILIKGPNEHTIAQIKEAIRDGLRAVSNTMQDECVLPGAGAYEVAASCRLKEYAKTLEGKIRIGIEAFANALLIIPRVLAENSGFDQ
jgi:T-complex protein 1 subunit zeta